MSNKNLLSPEVLSWGERMLKQAAIELGVSEKISADLFERIAQQALDVEPMLTVHDKVWDVLPWANYVTLDRDGYATAHEMMPSAKGETDEWFAPRGKELLIHADYVSAISSDWTQWIAERPGVSDE